jgi:methylated-DNA-[protein]-cysteine S-methyltransferase
MTQTVYWTTLRHQGQDFGLMASELGLAHVVLPCHVDSWLESYHKAHPWIQGIEDLERLAPYIEQVNQYLAGQRCEWTIPLDVSGTPFQLLVWKALREIPYGSVRSYREIAESINRPSAVRAVAGAVARNPLPLVIPCHRVIGSNGTLTGFQGGLRLKAHLLQLEGAAPVNPAGHQRFAF